MNTTRIKPIISAAEVYNYALSLNHDATMSEMKRAKTAILSIVDTLRDENKALRQALSQIEARAVYMKVRDPQYADTHWEYVRQACVNAIATPQKG